MKKTIITFAIGSVVLLGVAVLTFMNKTDNVSMSASTASVEQAENLVLIEEFAYSPESLQVKKGTTITWENRDNTRHNVVFSDESNGSVENGKLIGNGERVSYTFTEVGTYEYFCEPHPYMKAAIEVVE